MGTAVISIDAELGWGFHDTAAPPERIEAARSGWRRLADLLETYRIPATWAVVAHLLLEECDGRHADHPAGPGWFEREQTAWRDRPELRFGRDLIERVADADLDHEIASHTFSHVLFGSTTREIARAELDRARALARSNGFEQRSLVFPRNSVGHRDLLGEYGFEAYRGRRPSKPGPLAKLASATVREPDPRLVTPRLDEHGLVNVPASLYLFGFEGAARRALATVFEDPIVRVARSGIDAARHGEGVFHMWLHPNNLVTDADLERVESILAHLDERREELTIATMADVADTVRRRANP